MLRKLSFAACALMSAVLTCLPVVAQEDLSNSEKYLVGLKYLSKKQNIKLPDRWMFTDREPDQHFSVKSTTGAGKAYFHTLTTAKIEAVDTFMKEKLEKRGKMSLKMSSVTSVGSGLRQNVSWFVTSDVGTTYVLVHISPYADHLDLLVIEWPVDESMTQDTFVEKMVLEIGKMLKVTVDSFYGNNPWVGGEELIYNSMLANDAAKITIKLPARYVYAPDIEPTKGVHTWAELEKQSKTFSLVYATRSEGFEKFKQTYPDELQKRYIRASNEPNSGIIQTLYSTQDENKWDYVYSLTIQATSKDGKPVNDKAGKPVTMKYLFCSQYQHAGDGLIFGLTYKELLLSSFDNDISFGQYVDKTCEDLKGVFSNFKVEPINK